MGYLGPRAYVNAAHPTYVLKMSIIWYLSVMHMRMYVQTLFQRQRVVQP
jgi:hypothetical protein